MQRLRRLRFQFLLWFFAALIIREAHFAFVADSPLTLHPTSDEYEHWDLANHLAYVDWFARDRGAFHRPELFPYVLAILIRLTGGRIYWIHQAILVLDSLGVALLWLAARWAFDRRAAFWGALAAATYWPFVHFSGTLYMESFALFLQAAMLLTLVSAVRRLARRQRAGPSGSEKPVKPAIPSQVLWGGALIGLLLLTRPQTIITLPAIAVFLAAAAWRGRRPRAAVVLAPAFFGAMALLVLLPNAIRNYEVSGEWIWYSSNGALSFYFSNNDRNVSWKTVSPGMEWSLFIDMPKVEAGIGNDREARMEYWRRKSIDYVRNHFGHFIRHFYDKLLLVWNARAVHCTNNFEWMAKLSPVQRALPGFGVWGTVSVLGLILAGVRFVGTAGRRSFWREATAPGGAKGDAGVSSTGDGAAPGVADSSSGATRLYGGKLLAQGLLGTYAISYLFGVALFLAIERHRLPPLAPLFLFGGLWIAEGIGAVRRRRWKVVAAAVGATVMAAVLVNWPLRGPALLNHERYWTRVNLGVACRAEARDSKDDSWNEKARNYLIEAYDIYPDRLEPLHQLVDLAESRGKAAEARAKHARARGDDAEARKEYGEARRRYAEALHWHSLLLHQLNLQYPRYVDVRSEETAHHLILALKANRLDEAIRTGKTLVAMVPGNAQAHHLFGVALMAAGKNDAAKREFEQTLRLAPNHYEARENLKELDQLTSPTAPATPAVPEKPSKSATPSKPQSGGE